MDMIDYDLWAGAGTIVLEKEVSERLGAITGTFEFDFETYTDHYWEYSGGRDIEVPCLALDTVTITSVRYEDELGHRAAYAFEADEVEKHIEDLIESNLEKIEQWMKEDY